MTGDELLFFDPAPGLLPIYGALRAALTERFPDLRVKVAKTQISFYNRHLFAMVSLPRRRFKGFPREYLLFSLGMPGPLDSERAAAQSEPYPGRWTCHVPVCSEAEIDDELLGWAGEAYRFAQTK